MTVFHSWLAGIISSTRGSPPAVKPLSLNLTATSLSSLLSYAFHYNPGDDVLTRVRAYVDT